MDNTMMLLGVVRFSIDTAAYQQLQRSTQYQWAAQNRLGHPILKRFGIGGPTLQYIGPGDETISINGTMYPHYNGSPFHISLMRLQAGLGIPLPLISSSGGFVLGLWIVESIQQTDTALFSDGTARKIEFNLSLKRYTILNLL
ncbi:MAG: phage tail protein [Pseudomonadales bacterium]